MDDDLMERVLWQKFQGAGGFFFSSRFVPSLSLSLCMCIFLFVLIKKEVKIEGATVLQSEKNGVGKINRLTRRK